MPRELECCWLIISPFFFTSATASARRALTSSYSASMSSRFASVSFAGRLFARATFLEPLNSSSSTDVLGRKVFPFYQNRCFRLLIFKGDRELETAHGVEGSSKSKSARVSGQAD